MPHIENLRYWVALHFEMTHAESAALSDSDVLEKYRSIHR